MRAGIIQPMEWDAMYEGLPEKPRKAAEKKTGARKHVTTSYAQAQPRAANLWFPVQNLKQACGT